MAVLTLQNALNAQTRPCQAALTKPLLLCGKRSGKCPVGCSRTKTLGETCWGVHCVHITGQ